MTPFVPKKQDQILVVDNEHNFIKLLGEDPYKHKVNHFATILMNQIILPE